MTSIPSVQKIIEKYEGKRIKADNDHQLDQFFVSKGKLHYIDVGAAKVCEGRALPIQHLEAEEEFILIEAPTGGSYNALKMGKILDELDINSSDGTEGKKTSELEKRQTIWDKIKRHPVYIIIGFIGSIASIISILSFGQNNPSNVTKQSSFNENYLWQKETNTIISNSPGAIVNSPGSISIENGKHIKQGDANIAASPNNEKPIYSFSKQLRKGETFIDPYTGAVLGVSDITIDYDAKIALSLPGQKRQSLEKVRVGSSWEFDKFNAKFIIILSKINWINNSFEVEIRQKSK